MNRWRTPWQPALLRRLVGVCDYCLLGNNRSLCTPAWQILEEGTYIATHMCRACLAGVWLLKTRHGRPAKSFPQIYPWWHRVLTRQTVQAAESGTKVTRGSTGQTGRGKRNWKVNLESQDKIF